MSASLRQLIGPLRPFAERLLVVAGRAGLLPRVTSTRRSHAEQARLYRRYLAGANPFPVAPPGHSAHEFGFAFDLSISPMTDENLRALGQVWLGWGGVWGGAFNDPIHFEYPGFPYSAVEHVAKQSLRARIVNNAVSFLPAAGWLTIADPHPLQDNPVPWWNDPDGYAAGLKKVFLSGFQFTK